MATFFVSHCIWRPFFQIFAKTQIWQFIHISLWDLLCWSIPVDFRVTQMMPTSFVVCRQNFGELSLLRCPSPKKSSNPALQAEYSPLSSRMGTFQKSRSIQNFLRIWVWYVPTELGLSGPKKWGYRRRCLIEQQISGPKKDHVGKIGS